MTHLNAIPVLVKFDFLISTHPICSSDYGLDQRTALFFYSSNATKEIASVQWSFIAICASSLNYMELLPGSGKVVYRVDNSLCCPSYSQA